MGRLEVTHFSDPGCPWAWSASPALATLRWRYGDQLRWRHVMIGLTERGTEYERRGYTGEGMALGYRSFRGRLGMPFEVTPRERPHGTGRMCRVVVAARLIDPSLEWPVFRALQLAQFTSVLDLEDPEALEEALAWVPGVDAAAVVAAAGTPETEAAFAADRAAARAAAGGPTEFQGKAAVTGEGETRFTAPSLVFSAGGRSLEAGGFQPVEAYDVCIANLDRSLSRRLPAGDVDAVLREFPEGLTTAEAAAVMAEPNFPPDRGGAEDALIAAVASGAAERRPFGNDALWTARGAAAEALAA